MPVIDTFLAALNLATSAPATRRAIRADLRQFVRWWEQTHTRPFDAALCVDRDLHAWKRARQQGDGVAPSTINRALASLRRFFAWAVAQELLLDNPSDGVTDVPADPPTPRSLPDDAVDALLRAARTEPNPIIRARDEALLALLIYAGLRAQEACDVQLRDLDLAGAAVTVRRGKGGKPRRVPLHPDALRLIRRYLETTRCPDGLPAIGSPPEREPFLAGVAVTAPGQPVQPGISTGLVRYRVHTLGQRAAAAARIAATRERDPARADRLRTLAQVLASVSPHRLRHSLARRLLKSGAQLTEVQRILGHSRLSTTGMYLTPDEDDLRDAIGRAGV